MSLTDRLQKLGFSSHTAQSLLSEISRDNLTETFESVIERVEQERENRTVDPLIFDMLQCVPDAVEYDFFRRVGRLLIADRGYCDMTGCIKYFQSIDPGVEIIDTYNREGEVTIYTRQKSGKWIADRGEAAKRRDENA